MSNDSAALAGWAMNPNAPVDQRLAAAKQALDFYVDQQDQLEALLEHCEELADAANLQTAGEAYAAVRDRLRVILGSDDAETVGGPS